jgi:hypothetical protein
MVFYFKGGGFSMAGAVSNLMVRAGFDGSQLTRGLQQMQGEVKGAHSSICIKSRNNRKSCGCGCSGCWFCSCGNGWLHLKSGSQYDMMQENSKIAWTTLLGSTQKAKNAATTLLTLRRTHSLIAKCRYDG